LTGIGKELIGDIEQQPKAAVLNAISVAECISDSISLGSKHAV
jgi:hypothetical protein